MKSPLHRCYRGVGTKSCCVVDEMSTANVGQRIKATSISSSLKTEGATSPNHAYSLFTIRCTHQPPRWKKFQLLCVTWVG